MTITHADGAGIPIPERLIMMREGLIAVGMPGHFTLTPAGLAEARRIREEGNG